MPARNSNFPLTKAGELFVFALESLDGLNRNLSDPARFVDTYRATNSRSPRHGGHRHTVSFTAQRSVPLNDDSDDEDCSVVDFDGVITYGIGLSYRCRNLHAAGDESNNGGDDDNSARAASSSSSDETSSSSSSSSGSPSLPPASSVSSSPSPSISDIVIVDHSFQPIGFQQRAPGSSHNAPAPRSGGIRIPPRAAFGVMNGDRSNPHLQAIERSLSRVDARQRLAILERAAALNVEQQALLAADVASGSGRYQVAARGMGPASQVQRRRPFGLSLFNPVRHISQRQALVAIAEAERRAQAQRYRRGRAVYLTIARIQAAGTGGAVLEGPQRIIHFIPDNGTDEISREVIEDVASIDAMSASNGVAFLAAHASSASGSTAGASCSTSKRGSPSGSAGGPSKKARKE